MLATISRFPEPKNEPVLGYLPGSAERAALKSTLASMSAIVATAVKPIWAAFSGVMNGS